MSQFEKLIQRIRNNPKAVRFEELEKILLKCGYICNQPRGGSSHYTYRKKGKYPLTIPKKEPYVKETYIRLVIEALEEE